MFQHGAPVGCNKMNVHCLRHVYLEGQHQRYDDASDTAVVENDGMTPNGGCNPFWSDSIVFNQSSISSIIAALMLTLSVNRPLLLCPLEIDVNQSLGTSIPVFLNH